MHEFDLWKKNVTTGFYNANAFSSPIYFKRNAKLQTIQLPQSITYEQHIQRDIEVKRKILEQNDELMKQNIELKKKVINLEDTVKNLQDTIYDIHNKLGILVEHLNPQTLPDRRLQEKRSISVSILANYV